MLFMTPRKEPAVRLVAYVDRVTAELLAEHAEAEDVSVGTVLDRLNDAERVHPADAPTDLYRWFDAEGRLLYVGISVSAAERAAQHRAHKSWWAEVANMTVEHFSCRAEAQERERLAITGEKPTHNINYNTPRRTHTASPRPPRPAPVPCKDPGCVKDATAAGWCSAHYQLQRRHTGSPCSVEGCTSRVQAGGLCSMHYQRERNRGGLGPAETERIRGGRSTREAWEAAVATGQRMQRIDGLGPCLIHDGAIDGSGHAQVTYGRRRVARLSRLAVEFGKAVSLDSSELVLHRCVDETSYFHKRCFEPDHLYVAKQNGAGVKAAGIAWAGFAGRITPADKEVLEKMARAGATTPEIANQLGFTTQAVRYVWKAILPDVPLPGRDASPGRMTPADRVRLESMARAGATTTEIADALGFTLQAIRNMWRKRCPDVPFPSRSGR